jgi:hypothetical protein
MPPRLRGARYTRGTKRARGAASIARSKSATPTRWQSVVFVIPAHTTSARPTRSTGSPKNVALARNKTRSVACIKTAELRRLFLRAAPFVCAIFTCGRIDSALMLVELGASDRGFRQCVATAFNMSGRGLRRLATNSPHETSVLAHADSLRRKTLEWRFASFREPNLRFKAR